MLVVIAGFCGFGFGVRFMAWVLRFGGGCYAVGLVFAGLLWVGGLPLWFMGCVYRLVLVALDSYY